MKNAIKRLIAIIICAALTYGTVIVHNYIKNIPEESSSGNASTSFIEEMLFSDDPEASPEHEEYDPLEDLIPNNSVNYDVQKEYFYDEELTKYPGYTTKVSEGYKLSDTDYSSASSVLALSENTLDFSKEFSLDTYNTVKIVTDTDGRGGDVSRYESTTEECPLLRPYYGYILYTLNGAAKLLNSQGNAVLEDITGYEPVYRTTLAGEPLFKKGDKYYFYCDPESSKTLFFDDVEADSYTKLPAAEPGCAPYFNYEYYIILAKSYYAEENKQVLIPDIAINRPEGPCMVEYLVNEDTFISLTVSDATYSENKLGIYPFYSITDYTVDEETGDFKINQILWGYMDLKGNVVIEPRYKAAYSFSDEGYAVVVDTEDHVCVINKWGSFVWNPYYELYYTDPDAPEHYSRVIYFMPDTYGTESTGMFKVDNGYVRMRKKFVDTTIGDAMSCYITTNETNVLLNVITGEELVYPADYELISYSDGVMLLYCNGRYGYMTTDGIWLVEPILRVAKPFSEGLAVLGYRGDKLGVIDTEGNVVMPFVYLHIESCSGGVITAYAKDKGWTVYNKLSTENTADEDNPVIALKYRTLARAKFDYYEEEKRKAEEAKNTETEQISGIVTP